jgi:hypothetical protein
MRHGAEKHKLDIERHPAKHLTPTYSTDRGSVIGQSDRQAENKPSSIRTNFESAGKITLTSRLQPSKHPIPRFSTDEGTVIDSSPLSRNARHLIEVNSEFEQNEITFRDLHNEKHSFPTHLTDDGMLIVSSCSQLLNDRRFTKRTFEFAPKETFRSDSHL